MNSEMMTFRHVLAVTRSAFAHYDFSEAETALLAEVLVIPDSVEIEAGSDLDHAADVLVAAGVVRPEPRPGQPFHLEPAPFALALYHASRRTYQPGSVRA